MIGKICAVFRTWLKDSQARDDDDDEDLHGLADESKDEEVESGFSTDQGEDSEDESVVTVSSPPGTRTSGQAIGSVRTTSSKLQARSASDLSHSSHTKAATRENRNASSMDDDDVEESEVRNVSEPPRTSTVATRASPGSVSSQKSSRSNAAKSSRKAKRSHKANAPQSPLKLKPLQCTFDFMKMIIRFCSTDNGSEALCQLQTICISLILTELLPTKKLSHLIHIININDTQLQEQRMPKMITFKI